MMRRVQKSVITIDPVIKPDGLAYCLDCWKVWMLSDDRDLSASRMKLHGGQDDDPIGYESNPYDDQRKADAKIGEATNTAIEDMKACWRWAIYKKCSIATVWNFPRMSFMDVLADAEVDLEKKLKINIATATIF